MAEPTLTQIFGANATQTATELILNKADFAAIGLTADAANTAESLFAAIVALGQQYLFEANRDLNEDQSIYIEDGLPNLITRTDGTYRQQSKNIIFEKVDTQSTFDPDDY